MGMFELYMFVEMGAGINNVRLYVLPSLERVVRGAQALSNARQRRTMKQLVVEEMKQRRLKLDRFHHQPEWVHPLLAFDAEYANCHDEKAKEMLLKVINNSTTSAFGGSVKAFNERVRKIVGEVLIKAKEEGRFEKPSEARTDACEFYFLKASTVAALKPGSGERMPFFDEELLEKRELTLERALDRLDVSDIVAVSHRWETEAVPDTEGEQLRRIQEYLIEHPNIKFVWFDYSCMPQKPANGASRSNYHQQLFDRMLPCVNLIYLSASVLAVIDQSYISRFWTQFEAWLGFQDVTSTGLQATSDRSSASPLRLTIKTVHNATEEIAKHLREQWAEKTVEQAIDVLAKPDVTVTNQKDKVVQLGKLRTIDSMVKDAAEVQKLRRKESDRNATRGLRHGPIGSAVERESAGSKGPSGSPRSFGRARSAARNGANAQGAAAKRQQGIALWPGWCRRGRCSRRRRS